MKDETHQNIHMEVDKYELYELDKMILDEKHCYKRVFESKLKYIFDIKRPNGMNCIHENKVNNISECNLPYDMLDFSKCTKILNSHYSPILHGCTNTQKINMKSNNFPINMVLHDSRHLLSWIQSF